MKEILRIFAIVLLCHVRLIAQSPFQEITFLNISSSQGLSQNTVSCVLQDRRGFLWFGTADGLNRYDGYHFKVYRNELGNKHSLSNNYITALLEDKQGYIWVGTLGGGVNRFDPATEKFTRFRPHKDKIKGITGGEINNFAEDASGKIWISTNKKILSYFEPKHQRIIYTKRRHEQTRHARYVYSIVTEQNKGLWLGTRWGVAYFDEKLQKCTWHLSVNPNPVKFYYDGAIYRIVRDRVNPRFLWLCTFEAGLLKFDTHHRKIVAKWTPGVTQKRPKKTNSVWSFLQDRQGNCWVGTKQGFYKFDPQNNRFTLFAPNPQNPKSIAGSNIQQIFEDKAGTIWLGSFKNGISAFTPALNNFYHYKPNKSTNRQITSFIEDDKENLWFGTKGGTVGLTKLNQTTGEIITFKHDPKNPQSIATNNINTLLKDVDGSIWIGTIGKGLEHYDPTTGVFEHFPYKSKNQQSWLRLRSPHISTIFQDHRVPDELWIGSRGGGLVKLDKRKKELTKVYLSEESFNGTSLSQRTVIAITKDYKGNLWVATRKGLNRFDPRREVFTNYFHSPTNKQSISGNYITTLYIDKHQTLWIGTRNGLNKLDLKKVYQGQGASFQHYTLKQGLPNNVIHKIIESPQGFLWLSTSKGLSCFDKKEETFRNYDEQDGLQGNEFLTNSGLVTQNGAIVMGGTNGFNLFYPQKVNKNAYPPPVVFTDFQLFNKSVLVTEQGILNRPIQNTKALNLSYKDKVLSFEFAALNYILPNKNTYAVFMEGFDQDWSRIGTRRFVTYTALPAGTYKLRVKAANNDGVWSKQEAQMVVIVHPAWWQTWWFRGGMVLLTILVLIGAYFLRKYIIKIQEKKTKAVVIRHTSTLKKTNEALQKTLQELQAKEARILAKKSTRSIFRNKTEVEQLKQKLHEVIMEQALYKEEGISLARVAQKIDTTDKKLSELLNKELNTNFYDYLNSCRVGVFKERVMQGDAKQITLLAIAYESGFQSKATFNRIFKKHTGLTPSQFKKQVESTHK
ncbi:hypothetical protein BKI52_37080 [marine bacterium AO1-C]|nr:hypothetical protein BKI52_37080 [marine bacterium AO1-C]